MRPPMPYAGGKQSIADRIAELLPAHFHYLEPYAGALSVLLAKAPSKVETVNDLNEDLITFWRVLRDQPDELIRRCAFTPHSRRELQIARERGHVDDVEIARRVWVRLTQARSASMSTSAGAGWRFINGGGGRLALARYLDGYLERFAPVAARLRHVSLECRPALELIRSYGQHEDVCLYVDPPYLGEVRSQDRLYQHEMTSAGDHQELIEALLDCRSAVVLSGYAHELYDAALAGWHRHEFAALAQTGEARVEVVWSNRAAPHHLIFDSEAAGL